MTNEYRGRFAPSPTGPLHFGSLVAALGSYLDARTNQGKWLVRIEDVDEPRCNRSMADDILRTLEAFGLHWDESVIYQSSRTSQYEHALEILKTNGVAYPCSCTRKEIADSALPGIEGHIYPGNCRNSNSSSRITPAWRMNTENTRLIEFADLVQGVQQQHIESEIGDYVIKRADGYFAYQLAVVIDDAEQKITHVVRGADLLISTPRQIHLQNALRLAHPIYLHLPVAVNPHGEKLSKQTLATPLDIDQPVLQLISALEFLQQTPPAELIKYRTDEILEWGILNWKREKLHGIKQIVAA